MIANAFGIPPMLLGLEGDVNKATAAELVEDAFRGAISPMADLIASHITRDLIGKCIGWSEYEFIFNELSAKDESTELSAQIQLLQAGILTVDEVRAMRGLPTIAKDKNARTEQDDLEDRKTLGTGVSNAYTSDVSTNSNGGESSESKGL